MVHPTNLFRSDSEGGQRFSAPVGNYFSDIDCGITALPCLTQLLRLEKLAKLSVFITVLSLLGLVHGIVSTYFKGTSHLWFSHYNFPSFVEDWFVFLNEIFVGILALCISYWGNRMHRTTWMGALTMLIAVSGGTLAIPEIYNPFTKTEITNAITGPALCSNENEERYTKDLLGSESFNEVTFGYFFIFQIIFSMVTISFITHGLSYVDDHISAKHGPALLGLTLAAQEAGKQFGIYFSWVPYVSKIFSIFSSPVWILLIIITFCVGIAMAMFPKVLPTLAIKKSVNSLVSIASGGLPFDDDETEHSFCKVLCSLLKNKVLLLNIMSFVLMQSALVNFSLIEKYFNQSKYHVPIEEKDSTGYSDPDIIQFTTNLLRQPLVAVCMVTCGLIISKMRPKPKYLVIWIIVAFILVVLIFSSNVFLNCTKGIYNEHQHVITIPFCSSKCNCPYGESFQPVCVDGKTFFSPCLAGCRNYSSATSVYHNCSCGSVVTRGSCDQDNCKFVLAFAQVNNILSNGLVASTIIVNFLITFRSVPTKYKATALGLELTFLGIIPFIPIKIVYHFIANMFCEIHTLKGCQYFSESFPIVISVITISFMLGAIILAAILLYFVKDLKLYSNQLSNYNTTDNHNIVVAGTPNTTSGTSEENRAIEEDSPFIRQLGERIKSRLQRPSSREERIKTYIAEGELVPPLKKIKPPASAGTAVVTSTPVVRMEPSGESEILHEVRPNSRNSNKRHSKASGESDLSSLYRFADSIIDASDGNDSEPSIKVSQGKIVFQVAPQINTPKPKKPRHEPLILIAPDSTQPKRPAPVPHFLVETNL